VFVFTDPVNAFLDSNKTKDSFEIKILSCVCFDDDAGLRLGEMPLLEEKATQEQGAREKLGKWHGEGLISG
jgi:hypothetical protein